MIDCFYPHKRCYVCGYPYDLHKHHIFYGQNRRKLSEKYGCTVYLCANHHNMSNDGVHFDRELDYKLKMECQAWFEETFGDRDMFRRIFNKSYL